jgi:hypothetical protein
MLTAIPALKRWKEKVGNDSVGLWEKERIDVKLEIHFGYRGSVETER